VSAATLTLTDFLLARIAEDQAWAERASEEWGNPYAETEDRFDTVRVLAECESKRRIIEWHKKWPVLVEEPPTFEQDDAEGYDYARGDMSSMTMRMSQRIAWTTEQRYRETFGSEPPTGPVLRLLALPYADHPDYRDEWRP
jgi:hypothetical protein